MSVHGIYSRILVFFFIQLAKLQKNVYICNVYNIKEVNALQRFRHLGKNALSLPHTKDIRQRRVHLSQPRREYFIRRMHIL